MCLIINNIAATTSTTTIVRTTIASTTITLTNTTMKLQLQLPLYYYYNIIPSLLYFHFIIYFIFLAFPESLSTHTTIHHLSQLPEIIPVPLTEFLFFVLAAHLSEVTTVLDQLPDCLLGDCSIYHINLPQLSAVRC